MRWAMLVLVLAALGGCEPAWFSNGNNSSECRVNALPSGSCVSEGMACEYTENTGTSQRPAQQKTCRCQTGTWACCSFLPADAGCDAATE